MTMADPIYTIDAADRVHFVMHPQSTGERRHGRDIIDRVSKQAVEPSIPMFSSIRIPIPIPVSMILAVHIQRGGGSMSVQPPSADCAHTSILPTHFSNVS